jgi:hypothetical protein
MALPLRVLIRIALTVAALLAACKPTHVEAPIITCEIEGVVVDPDGRPLSGVIVTVATGGAETLTDTGGNFKTSLSARTTWPPVMTRFASRQHPPYEQTIKCGLPVKIRLPRTKTA